MGRSFQLTASSASFDDEVSASLSTVAKSLRTFIVAETAVVQVTIPLCCAAQGWCGCSACGGPPSDSPQLYGRRLPAPLPPEASTVHTSCDCPLLSYSTKTGQKCLLKNKQTQNSVFALHLPALPGCHDNDEDALLPDHSPEIIVGFFQRSWISKKQKSLNKWTVSG